MFNVVIFNHLGQEKRMFFLSISKRDVVDKKWEFIFLTEISTSVAYSYASFGSDVK